MNKRLIFIVIILVLVVTLLFVAIYLCTHERKTIDISLASDTKFLKEKQIYVNLVDLGKQASMIGPVSANNVETKRKFVSQGSDIIQLAMELTLHDSYVDDTCRPDIANNYFRPLINLVCYSSDVAEADSKFYEASKFAIVLLQLGNSIADGGYDEDYNCRTTCVYHATKRLFRLSENINHAQCLSLIENIRKLLEHSRHKDETEQFRQRICLKEGQSVPISEKRFQRFEFQKNYYQTALTLCLAKLSVQAHYSKFGEFPKELASSSIEEFQFDINNSPWHIAYQVNENTYSLYSFGPDGIDDGGDFVSIDQLERTGKGDLVFEDQ